jgi:glycerol uptake facilitator-like aquaporin
MFAAKGNLPRSELAGYVAAQIVGGILGTVAAHLMFAMPIVEFSEKVRSGPAQWFAEAVATFGLVGVILGGLRFNNAAIPWLVGLYITAAYWFTASTSFANPAVTIARALTNSFSGISPWDVPEFVVAQLVGMAVGAFVFSWLLESRKKPEFSRVN